MASSSESVARIFVDVLIIGTVGLSAVLGWRKGFAAVLFSCFRWLICIAASIIGAFPLKAYLVEKSSIDLVISTKLKAALLSPVSGFQFFSSAPEQMQHAVNGYEQSLAGTIANTLTERMLSVICFLAIFLLLIVVTKLILLALSRKEKKGPIGIINGFLGFLFGALRGAFIVCIVLLAIFPLCSFSNPEGATPIVEGIRASQLASLLYDHNPILIPFELF